MKKLLWTGLLVFLLPAISLAQLTADDLDQLRQQAVEEGWTFEITANPATQVPLEQLTGLVVPEGWEKNARFNDIKATSVLPDAFDWRDNGGLPPIRNQAGCGSCWAFSSLGALECNIKVRDLVTVDLSEQWLLSCNTSGFDCEGGWWCHDYLEWKPDACGGVGAVMEDEFPYVATELPCGCPYNREYTIQGWAYVGTSGGVPSVESLKEAIYTYGPISVAVHSSSSMQAYGGGIFNSCATGEINHAVLLVGWDDNQGDAGIWIMRNSWGTNWGEDGYMRMPYGCASIGYSACYVDYHGGAYLVADTCVGWSPLDVEFQGLSGLAVNQWTWDFGDGDSAFVQNPTHTYEEPGLYDVTIKVEAGEDVRSHTRYDYIAALADTMWVDQITVGSTTHDVEVDVYGRNYCLLSDIRIPVEYSGTLNLDYDSFSVAGCRTEGFEMASQINYVSDAMMCFRIMNSEYNSSSDLEPGVGPLLKLYYHIVGSASVGQVTSIILDGYATQYMPKFSGDMAEYTPAVEDGQVGYFGCCQGITGNINNDPDQIIDISDLVYLVNYMFNDGPEPPCLPEASVDGDIFQVIDIGDLVYLVSYMFSDGPAPTICF
ncbi:MAG TPA: C1 family peptidase [candidate division Zixibacteria bacterium]|nr:C1 family peptidase [candidate division Zixibacteria bacterium]